LSTIEDEKEAESELKKISAFMDSLPYRERTVFGFATLFDPRLRIKDAAYSEKDGIECMGLDAAENITMEYLIKGRYYADTGSYHV
jgi:hypothetical protein